MFTWFKARCNDQQLPPRCKKPDSTKFGNCARSAGGKAPRRIFAPERISPLAIEAPVDGLEPSIVSLTGSRPTDWATPDRYTFTKSTQRESNPHIRHGKAVGYHYIMGAFASQPNCQRSVGIKMPSSALRRNRTDTLRFEAADIVTGCWSKAVDLVDSRGAISACYVVLMVR